MITLRPFLLHLKKIAGFVFSAILVFNFFASVNAQNTILKPGFDKAEYIELIRMHARLYDTTKNTIPYPVHFKSVYNSPIVGMDNRWDLWKNTKSAVAVINLRGTTTNPVSWLQNFYAAMVPAQGELKLSNNFTFKYHLAENPRAAVHVGWLIGIAYLARDIIPKIDSCYKSGIKEFIIMGHSQGGALSYLMTSHLYSLQKQNILPKDIRFKTYSSAAPKAGNVYYAYEYESLVDGGWGVNIINGADWVPQTPFSVQNLSDFNETNPFRNIDGVLKKQKFFTRIALRHAYKQLKKPSEKAQRNYQKYLGNYVSKMVKKTLPEFQPPVYAKTADYVRIGPTITLLGDDAYYKLFPDSKTDVFAHHLLGPYLYLIDQYKH
ncbi:lipase family protein [Dyadobacter sp. CY356]|uniref:lipase family protein n=1 Tax=Dyadobacter sp. CY356 TaxID=2906442 RepID=UPI001F48C7FD|nr:lipase family protein [Dyadobacter sp. CY356]MCF0054436.1 lipase family protein [Dyadobacter sp. CY356]